MKVFQFEIRFNLRVTVSVSHPANNSIRVHRDGIPAVHIAEYQRVAVGKNRNIGFRSFPRQSSCRQSFL